MEKIPHQVADALHRGDRKALHAMAVAGGKASAEVRKFKALNSELHEAEKMDGAPEAERALNLSPEGDVRPPEEAVFKDMGEETEIHH